MYVYIHFMILQAFLNILSNFVQSNKKNMNKIKKSLTFALTQIPIMEKTEKTINADINGIINNSIFKNKEIIKWLNNNSYS